MGITTSLFLLLFALLAWREVVRARAWIYWFAQRCLAALDRLEEHMCNSPGELFAPPPPPLDPAPEEHPTTDALPPELYVMHDEVQAKLEELRRTTRGADQGLVCSHWYEQDEREAEQEAERLRAALKRIAPRKGVN